MSNELIESGRNFLPNERATDALLIIDSNHAQIHGGNAYSLGELLTINAGVSVDVSVQVPAGAYVHYQASDITTDGGNTVTATMYEGSTITGGTGTPLTPVNRRRIDTPAPSLLTVKQGPTVQAVGTRLDQWYFPKTADANSKGFNGKSDTNEWVLKQDTTYLLRISNTGTVSAAVVSLRPFWYEEADA